MAHEIPQNFALRTEEHAPAGRGNPVAEETGDKSKTRQNDVARRTGKTTRRGHGFVNGIGSCRHVTRAANGRSILCIGLTVVRSVIGC